MLGNMFYSYATMLLNLIVIYFTAIHFGLEVRGEIQLYLSYKIMIGAISSLGLSTGYLYFWKEKKHFISPLFIFAIVSIVALLITLFSKEYTYDVELDYLLFLVVIEALNISALELLKKDDSLSAYFKGLFLGQCTTLCLFLSFIFLEVQPSKLIAIYIGGGVLQLVYLLMALYKIYGLNNLFKLKPDLPYAKVPEYWFYLGGVSISAILTTFILNFDKIFIAKHLSMTELGIYSTIGSVMMIINRFFNVLAMTYFAKRINSKGNILEVKYTYIIPFIILIAILSYVIGPYILSVAISKEFEQTGLVIALLLTAALFSGINAIVLQDFNVMGKPHYNIPRQVITFIVLLINLMIFDFLAIEGIALAIMITSIFRLITAEFLRKKLIHVKP